MKPEFWCQTPDYNLSVYHPIIYQDQLSPLSKSECSTVSDASREPNKQKDTTDLRS